MAEGELKVVVDNLNFRGNCYLVEVGTGNLNGS